MENIYLLVPVG